EAAGFVLWNARVGERVAVLAELGWLFATEEERDGWSSAAPAAGAAAPSGERLATEPARRLAAQLGVSLDDVPGSGIVRESDVRALASAPAEPRPEEAPTVGRLSDELRERLRGDAAEIAALGQIGASCRFFCRDFVAGDVVTLRWNVAVVDGQGGIHDCRVGDLCFVAYETYLNTDRDVTLGERVCLSPGARIYTHRKWLEALDGYPFSYAPVSIGERSWLGPGSLILPGVVLDPEVTVMANSVVASNAPRGALLGGVPAAVVKREQRAELDASHRAAIVREIFEGNTRALAVLGWTLEPEERGDAAWAGRLRGGPGETRVAVDGRTITVGDTVFDLDERTVSGPRNGATDVVRHLLFKYGHAFEPRLWRFGARLDESRY